MGGGSAGILRRSKKDDNSPGPEDTCSSQAGSPLPALPAGSAGLQSTTNVLVE